MKRRRPGPRPLALAPGAGPAAAAGREGDARDHGGPGGPSRPAAAGAAHAAGGGGGGGGGGDGGGGGGGGAGEEIQDADRAAEIWALEEKVRALEEKNKALSQENFDLKSELWMRSAEEKHSNAPIVKSLQEELNFKERELRESDNAMRKEREWRKKLQEQHEALQQQIRKLKRAQVNAQAGPTRGRANLREGQSSRPGEARPLQMQPRQALHANATPVSNRTPGQARSGPKSPLSPPPSLTASSSTLSSTSSIASSSASSTLTSSPPLPPQQHPGPASVKLPSYFTSEDHVIILRHLEHSNAVALSEGQVERVLIDEVALRLDSGRMDALEAVLRVLSKCIRQRRPSLADGIASALLVPAFVKYYDRSRTAVPTHLEMQTCAAIAGFLTPLARRTRKPCAQGKALAQGFANLVNGQQGHLEAWLEAPGNCWAQVLELFSVVTAVQAPQLEAATLPDMYRLLDLHRQQTSFHPMLTPVLEFCASLVLVKPSSISARGDEDPDWRSRLIELLQELADAGFESATWIRITITKAAMKA